MNEEIRCSAEEGCNNKVFAKGYCRKHYMRVYRSSQCKEEGCTEPIHSRGYSYCISHSTCRWEGCDKPLHSSRYCRRHYYLETAYQDPAAEALTYGSRDGSCHCGKKIKARGLCAKHHSEWLRLQKKNMQVETMGSDVT